MLVGRNVLVGANAPVYMNDCLYGLPARKHRVERCKTIVRQEPKDYMKCCLPNNWE
jgi:hypothetical protein